MKVLIVGGVAGGASAAARLRRLDEKCEIVLLERGEYISFANCGLPYYVGEVIREKNKLVVQTPAAMKARFNIDIRTLNEVEFIDTAKKEVEITDLRTGRKYREKYDKLILSPGAAPIKPPVPGLDAANVFTLRNIPDTYTIKDFVDSRHPKRAVVIGGGFIGVELAENLAERGVKVTLVELANQILGPIDFEMAALVHQYLKEKGIELYLEDGLKSVSHTDKYSIVSLNSKEEIKTDMIVLGIGVTPENKLAKTADLELGERGAIKVNKALQTSNPDIYAVGDAIEVIDFVNGRPTHIPLAGPANKQGRIAANNICGLYEEYPGTQGTSVLKVFDYTVAATGNNEKTLKRFNIPYGKSFTHSLSHAGYYRGATPVSLKILFSPADGKILGAQAVGFQGIEKRIDVIATAIRAGMTVYDLEKLELSYAPPYSSAKDPVNMAGYVAANILKGDCRVIHWHEMNSLDQRASQVVDVRTPLEFGTGSVAGAVNIPIDDLRQRINEIPRDKDVIVYCQVGLRGYLAYRILVQNGYTKVRNLSGGYKTYSTAMGEQSNRNVYRYEDLLPAAPSAANTTHREDNDGQADVQIDCSGLQCPGPIMQVNNAINSMEPGEILAITATDPGFAADIEAWCRSTGNQLLSINKSVQFIKVYIKKGGKPAKMQEENKMAAANDKTMVVFSSDLDKAIAAFIIANGAAAMGRKVTMFFTFWGLNILRKSESVNVKKNLLESMFGKMMPRGSKKLGLSRMNMGGLGGKMIRYIMGAKNVASLEDLMDQARKQGVRLVACNMSMDVMGIKPEELIDGVEMGGVASYLNAAESADTNLFI
ncbi:DsrE/DsrF/DrsH-like family protein [Methylomusa anaerophila]|uniref:Coenzyme A disulfide reductase n=1 Tax=Methylomusa anaerophila TaxID=1930071 RepID=A0A348AG95_9FIRM|nr:DsrE/DsrF/DrsH-like family protein [Methylomusa anaerophila]BBB90093.1 coenzyme A disulfide reductase [Methylomusa anaerophila]